MRWQSLDLLDVEDGVALQEMDGALDVVAGRGVLLGTDKSVRVDDGRTFLALADVRVEFDGLPVGHPDGCCETLHAG